jgi:sensor histidine kinase regulating citrate/malate metabolism
METPAWYKNPTIDSIIVILVIVLVTFFGVEITAADIQASLEQLVIAVAAFIALVHQIYRQVTGKNKE